MWLRALTLRSGWLRGWGFFSQGGLCACVSGGGNACMRVHGHVIKQLSPFMCVKCVRVCVCVERSEKTSIGCERGKGSCLWPDLAQGGGSAYIVQSFHLAHCN